MIIKTLGAGALTVSMLLGASATAIAEDYDACKGAFTFVESTATYEDFDFWLGEWQVFDTNSGELRGYDVIEMVHDGCTLHQEWRQMDNAFSLKASPVRLRGSSLTGIDAKGEWRQLWTDNSGSNMLMSGGLDDEGTMVLTSEWISFTNSEGKDVSFRNILSWKPMEDGSVHNWGEQQTGGDNGPKTVFYDIMYRRNNKTGAAFTMKK